MEEIKVAGKSIEVLVKKGTIDFDFELMKSQLEEVLKMYGGCVFSEDNLAAAKKEIADLRKQQKALDKCRIEVTKEFNSTAEEFGAKMKEAVKLFDKPIGELDGQVQEFEEKRKAEKHEQVVAIFEEITEPIKEYCPISRFCDERWDNVSVTLTSARKDIQTLTDKIQSELSVIKAMNSECEAKALERYKVANNLADAVLFINQYEKQKADILRMEQERKAEEERRKLEEERKVLEPEVILEEVEEPLKDFGHVFEPQQEPQAEEFKLCYQYTITGTKRELDTIDTFLDSIGVDWSK